MQKTILAILLICCLPTHAIAQTSYEELSQISEPTSKKLLLPLIFLTDDNFSEDEKWVEYFACDTERRAYNTARNNEFQFHNYMSETRSRVKQLTKDYEKKFQDGFLLSFGFRAELGSYDFAKEGFPTGTSGLGGININFAYSVFDTRCGDGERINSLVTRPAGWPKKAVIKADFESLDVFPATAEIGEELVSRMTVRTGQTDRRISIQLIVRVDPQTIDINQDEEQIDLQGKIVAARILSADNSWALPGLTPLGDYPAFTE